MLKKSKRSNFNRKASRILPDSHDLRDALEHMGGFICSDEDLFSPEDFTYKFYPDYPVSQIKGDLRSWLEFRKGEFKGLGLDEVEEELASFRGAGWARRAIGWLEDGDIPPVIMGLTPEFEDIADGQGRVNLAIAMGMKTIPAWVIKTDKLCDGFEDDGLKLASDHTIYYHGTKDARKGEAILQSRSILPGVSSSPKSKMAPIQGRVYLSKNPSYALIYALGGDMAGGTFPDSMIQREGRYGYLFAVKEIDSDKVIPDEDSVGELIYKHKQKEITAPSWFMALAYIKLTDNQWHKIIDGDYGTWAQGGKKLLKFMTPSQKKELLKVTEHVSHEGELQIVSAWRVDKTRSKEFKRDGSNIFDVAEKVSVPKVSRRIITKKASKPYQIRDLEDSFKNAVYKGDLGLVKKSSENLDVYKNRVLDAYRKNSTKPFLKKDEDRILSILNAAESFYKENGYLIYAKHEDLPISDYMEEHTGASVAVVSARTQFVHALKKDFKDIRLDKLLEDVLYLWDTYSIIQQLFWHFDLDSPSKEVAEDLATLGSRIESDLTQYIKDSYKKYLHINTALGFFELFLKDNQDSLRSKLSGLGYLKAQRKKASTQTITAYHGSSTVFPFEEFDSGFIGSGIVSWGSKGRKGFFFTTEKENARFYTENFIAKVRISNVGPNPLDTEHPPTVLQQAMEDRSNYLLENVVDGHSPSDVVVVPGSNLDTIDIIEWEFIGDKESLWAEYNELFDPDDEGIDKDSAEDILYTLNVDLNYLLKHVPVFKEYWRGL